METSRNSVSVDLTIEHGSVGRNLSDVGWEYVDAQHISYWKSAQKTISKRQLEYRNWKITITSKWASIIRRMQYTYKVYEKLFSPIPKDKTKIAKKFKFTPVTTKIHISAKKNPHEKFNDKGEKPPPLDYIAESFCCDFFLIMNIAAPGSCNFGGSTIIGESKHKLSLSEFWFDFAYLDGRDGKWPAPEMIPLDDVCRWFFAIRTNVSQIPKNRMEKVLFSILHISASNSSPTTIIWIFYGLETLFDTKAGENFRVLFDRISLLLSPNDKQLSVLRKNLRKIYGLRSALVHGGLEIGHPMQNDALDSDFLDEYYRLTDATSFGFSLLLCSIQEVIKRGWKEPQYDEVLTGSLVTSR